MNHQTTRFPDGFFDRQDESADDRFYAIQRLVTHIDAGAIAAVGELYEELGLTDDNAQVLDICSSWVSHLSSKPGRLSITGMNPIELSANAMADDWTVLDLNEQPGLPFDKATFDAGCCCVSVDYLIEPVAVFKEMARVLRPGGVFVCTFSNRCFPSKAIRGWLEADDRSRCAIVAAYFSLTSEFDTPEVRHCNHGAVGDPLYAVWAKRR
ncbi:MAG: methyltransferase domain-containing protein [Granulosicoccus sp.]